MKNGNVFLRGVVFEGFKGLEQERGVIFFIFIIVFSGNFIRIFIFQ